MMSKQPKTQEQPAPKSDRPAGKELSDRELQKVSGGQQSGRRLGDGSV
jgi:bacteriocin-like protein